MESHAGGIGSDGKYHGNVFYGEAVAIELQ